MAWTSLCETEQLKEGEGKYVEIGGFQLAVFLHQGNTFVIDNECPHAGGNLAGGMISDGCAVCPWHYWAFKLDTGEMRDMPQVKVGSYKIRTIDHEGKQMLQVDLPTP